MFAHNVQSEYLPSINSLFETLRLGWGTCCRLCLYGVAYYGMCGVISEKILGRNGSIDRCERDGMRYFLSMGGEVVLSLAWAPMKYLAAVNTPRFLLDYLLTSWSDVLAIMDRFHAGKFASYAMYTFATHSSEDEWNLSFFSWQVPSVTLTVSKLISRRRRVGAETCRTKRVVGVLLLQVLLRAYMSSFSLMLPETGSEAVEAMVVTVLESASTSYLVRHTWPFPYDDLGPFTTIKCSTEDSNSQDGESTPTTNGEDYIRAEV